jgi:hypothetical protein
MSGSERFSRSSLTALATLAASAALFFVALFGIASMDPSADAAGPGGGAPAIHNIGLDENRDSGHDRRDCPFKNRDRDRTPNGEGVASGVRS